MRKQKNKNLLKNPYLIGGVVLLAIFLFSYMNNDDAEIDKCAITTNTRSTSDLTPEETCLEIVEFEVSPECFSVIKCSAIVEGDLTKGAKLQCTCK